MSFFSPESGNNDLGVLPDGVESPPQGELDLLLHPDRELRDRLEVLLQEVLVVQTLVGELVQLKQEVVAGVLQLHQGLWRHGQEREKKKKKWLSYSPTSYMTRRQKKTSKRKIKTKYKKDA